MGGCFYCEKKMMLVKLEFQFFVRWHYMETPSAYI